MILWQNFSCWRTGLRCCEVITWSSKKHLSNLRKLPAKNFVKNLAPTQTVVIWELMLKRRLKNLTYSNSRIKIWKTKKAAFTKWEKHHKNFERNEYSSHDYLCKVMRTKINLHFCSLFIYLKESHCLVRHLISLSLIFADFAFISLTILLWQNESFAVWENKISIFMTQIQMLYYSCNHE